MVSKSKKILLMLSVIVSYSFISISSSIAFAATKTPSHVVDMEKLLKDNQDLPEMVKGSSDAPLTVVEYASLTCSHCATFFLENYPKIKEKYVDTGKVKFIFREFPVDPFSLAASMVARCAAQKDYFPVVSDFFTNQARWLSHGSTEARDYIFTVGRKFGLNDYKIITCLENKVMSDKLNSRVKNAVENFKIEATPAFVINGKVYYGTLSVKEMSEILDEELGKLKK